MAEPETSEELGYWLTELREAAGLSQAGAAEHSGLSERGIRRWESGEIPRGLTLLRLFRLYGVKIEPPPPGYRPADVASVIEAVVAELADLRTTILATLSGPGGGDQPQGGSSAAPTPEAGRQ